MTYFTTNQQYPLGIDLSVYNSSADGRRRPNFDLIAAHQPSVEFIAMRAGQSWGYRDPAFSYYLAEAQRIGVCILPYHVVFPGESARRQMDSFLRILAGVDLASVRLVLDLELDHGQTRSKITQTLNECLQILQAETSRLPLVYSRTSWVNEHLSLRDLPELDWWLAQYLPRRSYPAYTPEFPCPPRLPEGLSVWRIHQTSERAPAIGGSGWYMDYDRWNGTRAELMAYFGRAEKQPAEICPLDGLACPRRKIQPNSITAEQPIAMEVI